MDAPLIFEFGVEWIWIRLNGVDWNWGRKSAPWRSLRRQVSPTKNWVEWTMGILSLQLIALPHFYPDRSLFISLYSQMTRQFFGWVADELVKVVLWWFGTSPHRRFQNYVAWLKQTGSVITTRRRPFACSDCTALYPRGTCSAVDKSVSHVITIAWRCTTIWRKNVMAWAERNTEKLSLLFAI